MWDLTTGVETVRFELDAAVKALAAIAPNTIVAGDELGLLHWLGVLD